MMFVLFIYLFIKLKLKDFLIYRNYSSLNLVSDNFLIFKVQILNS